MKTVLFTANIDAHILAFHLPLLKWFKAQGWHTVVASAGRAEIPDCDEKIDWSIRRNPFTSANIGAYRQLKRLLSERHFDIIHCHTPVASVLTRLAARSHRVKKAHRVTGKPALIYTSHGYHFYKGGPLAQWLTFYPLERWLSRRTDAIVTINRVDYELTLRRFHAKAVFQIPGVGYDESRFYLYQPNERMAMRTAYFDAGSQASAATRQCAGERLLIYVAELNQNKNQCLLIESLAKIRSQGHRCRLILVGQDRVDGVYARLARTLGVEGAVDFLGMRRDVDKLIPMCDIAVASSLREGLGINILEAMACGLPVVATATQGHQELIRDGDNGFIVAPGDPNRFAEQVCRLLSDPDLCEQFAAAGLETAKAYTRAASLAQMIDIYKPFMM